jgi:hypothetical protein
VTAVALCVPPTVYSLAYPAPFSFAYPSKRFYSHKDMQAIASRVVEVVGGVPATTVDYWLRRADLVSQGCGPRRTSYGQSDVEYFALYCLCHRTYANAQEANRVYDKLSEN